MKKQILVLFSGLLIAAGCSSNKKSNPIPPPQQALLVFPALNALCNQGTPVAAGESSVTFKWNNGANADSYELNIKNLLNGAVTTQSATGTQLPVTLAENTPYSWWVVSRSDKSILTATTDPWKFYNSGPGTVNYAPFPAELISPGSNQSVSASNGALTLSWKGSAVDSGVLTYDLYFGPASNPGLLKSGLMASQYGVMVSAGTIYYWKIVTRDANGNSSDSGVSEFSVN